MTCSRKIKLRRESCASLLAKALTEEEIAQRLNVGQATISRDVRYLKALAQSFVYDLAKTDLAYYYKQGIDGIQEVKRRVWFMLDNNKLPNSKDQIPALKLAKECDEAIFNLFSQGPSIMNIRALEERVNKIESFSTLPTAKGQISK
jgi:Trp repressor protein